jgi:hypothetical protein
MLPVSNEAYCIAGLQVLGGRLYIAKSGKTRENFGDIINSDHWTSEAECLAKQVGVTTDRNHATRLELQLMAFYITRTLAESGNKPADLRNLPILPINESRMEVNKIIINVSQPVCEKCGAFTIIINGFAKNHGHEFEPTNNARMAAVENGQGSGPSRRVTIISE